MWLFVHITFLTGFKNRFAPCQLGGTFLRGGRAERTITIRQVVGRIAIDEAGGEELTDQVIAVRQPGSNEPQKPDGSSEGARVR